MRKGISTSLTAVPEESGVSTRTGSSPPSPVREGNGFAGDGGNTAQAVYSNPMGVVAPPSGIVYVADRDNQRVRAFQPGGTINTVAGIGLSVGDGGPAAAAHFNQVQDIAFDKNGNVTFRIPVSIGSEKFRPGESSSRSREPAISDPRRMAP